MDFRLIASTFGLIFLAELGDKTQLATMTMAASSRAPLSVFLGASLALVVLSGAGAFLGAGLAEVIPMGVVRTVAAIAFILVGIAMLLKWI